MYVYKTGIVIILVLIERVRKIPSTVKGRTVLWGTRLCVIGPEKFCRLLPWPFGPNANLNLN